MSRRGCDGIVVAYICSLIEKGLQMLWRIMLHSFITDLGQETQLVNPCRRASLAGRYRLWQDVAELIQLLLQPRILVLVMIY